MFKREFFLSAPVQIPIILAFCFSVGSLFAYMVVNIIKYRDVKIKPKYAYHISECLIVLMSATMIEYFGGTRRFNWVLSYSFAWPLFQCLLWWCLPIKQEVYQDTIQEHYGDGNTPKSK